MQIQGWIKDFPKGTNPKGRGRQSIIRPNFPENEGNWTERCATFVYAYIDDKRPCVLCVFVCVWFTHRHTASFHCMEHSGYQTQLPVLPENICKISNTLIQIKVCIFYRPGGVCIHGGGVVCIQGGWTDPSPLPPSDTTGYGQQASGTHPT